MNGTAGSVLVVAVTLIAVAQIGLFLYVLATGRRLFAKLIPLLEAVTEASRHLQETLDRVGALAEQTGDTVEQARRAARHVGAIAGAGRSLVESALGRAIVRRILPSALGATAPVGTSPVLRMGVDVALGLYQAWIARKARQKERDAAPAGLLGGAQAMAQTSAAGAPAGAESGHNPSGIRLGTIRRLDNRPDGRASEQAGA